MIKIDTKNTEQICSEFTTRILNKSYRSENLYYLYYKEHMRRIITCPADSLYTIIDEFGQEFDTTSLDTEWNFFCQYMKRQYELFIKKNGIWLAQQLNVSVCPYCNRQYTFTIDGQKKIRPQFDHFYPKSRYPYLALSFYNLIPCCPICNHVKGDREITHNPYITGFHPKCNFKIDRIDKCLMDKENWNISFTTEGNYKKNIETFSLWELYNRHKDYAKEIAFKAIAYESSYLESLEKEFAGLKLSKPEMERIIWGNYIDPNDFGKRPLSKLTHDIRKQMKE